MAQFLHIPEPESVSGGPELLDIGVQRRVLRAFGSSTGRPEYLLYEVAYFDIDYRSEFSVIYAHSFTAQSEDASRVHMFSAPKQLPKTLYLHDFVYAARRDYLGYFIVRPSAAATVGRSLIRPGAQLTWLQDVSDTTRHIRTAVSESIDVFGVPLEAVGVPFMQQDGRVLRCANVSAWMCHYSAVMRGVVPRRLAARFHEADDPAAVGFGRSYPSQGLSIMSLNRILQRTDLPPDVRTSVDLVTTRTTQWFDRSVIWERVASAVSSAPPAEADELEATVWAYENLVTIICRYLNSGVPVIAVRNGFAHMQVITGYLRAADLTPEKRSGLGGEEPDDEIVAFVAQDDTWGPYRQVWAIDLVKQLLEHPQGIALVIPLPTGLWLDGAAAETSSAAILTQISAERAEEYEAWARKNHVPLARRQDAASRLRELADLSGRGEPGDFGLRTYASFGRDFKESLLRNLASSYQSTARFLGYLPLPRFVWVVEVVDRRLRRTQREHVVATVVLDATEVASAPGMRQQLTPLLVHLPGQISTFGFDVYGEDSDVMGWHPAPNGPYRSSRWTHGKEWLTSPRYVAARFKGAVPQ